MIAFMPPSTLASMLPGTSAPLHSGTLAPSPSLEYQHAFDCCAVEAHRTEGPIAVFASSPFYARELLKRLQDREVTLVAVGEWRVWASDLQQWLGVEIDPSSFSLSPPHLCSSAHCAIWAEPERIGGVQALCDLREMLLPGAKLYVISSGWLARFLPEWRQKHGRPSEHPVGLRRVISWLRHSDFAIEALYGFHGPWSIFWGYASRWIERLGRGDLADRCLFQMRATYVVRGGQAFLAPVGLACAQWRENKH